MKTICLDARLLTAPGIGTYLKNLFSQVKDTPWEWSALVHPDQVDKLSAWPEVQPILFNSKIYSIKEQLELSLKIPKADLFWSPHYNVPCLPIRARRRLVSIHDVFHLIGAANLVERCYAEGMMYAATHLSDRVLTGSFFSEKEIRKHTRIGTRPITVIHHGIDKTKFHHKGEETNADFLEKYNLKTPFLLYVGSFKAHKNLKGLVAAFSQVAEKNPDLELVIVGGGAGMRHCEDVKQLCIAFDKCKDKLRFVGQVPDRDLPHFYRCAQMLIFPSTYEGFGLPPLEAMHCGCPAIVSHAASLPEVCADGAVYFDPKNPLELADRILELIHDPSKRQELAQRGLNRSRDFCLKKFGQAHFSLIEELL